MRGIRVRYIWLLLVPTILASGECSVAQGGAGVGDVWVSQLLASARDAAMQGAPGAPAVSPSVPGDVGTTDGSFAVGPSGSATYVIPIPCPAGTAGMQPVLNLAYDSQGPTGSLGIGWSVGGLSSITRGPKNIARDGVVGGVQLDSDDAYFLDGARLIPVRVDPTTSATEYRSETDPTAVVVAMASARFGPESWRVTTKAGLTMEFGLTENSRITVARTVATPDGPALDQRVLSWACERITDTLGNFISFSYVSSGKGDYDLLRVTYTGNDAQRLVPYAAVDFTYEDAPRGSHGYLAGFEVIRTRRLRRIRSHIDQTTMCQFDLDYEERDSVARFRLTRITESGRGGGAYRPLRFTYTESEAGWNDSATQAPPVSLRAPEPQGPNPGPLDEGSGVVYADVNNDGAVDFLYAAAVAGTSRRITCLNTADGWRPADAMRSPIDFSIDGRRDPDLRVVDVNGDGWVDILRGEGSLLGPAAACVWLNDKGSGWKNPGFVPKIVLGEDGGSAASTRLLDLDGDGDLDLMWRVLRADGTEDKGAQLLDPTAGWTTSASGYIPPFPIVAHENNATTGAIAQIADARGVLLVDVDRDGLLDLVYHRHVKGVEERHVYIRSAAKDKWEEVTDKRLELPFAPPKNLESMLVLHLDDDAFKDLLVSMPAVGGSPELLDAVSIRPLDPSGTGGGWTRIASLSAPPFRLAVDATLSISARPARIVKRDASNRTEDVLVACAYVDPATKQSVVLAEAYENGGASGWIGRSEFRPPFVFTRYPADPANPVGPRNFVIDLNKDGGSDLVEYDRDAQGLTIVRAYLWSSTQWRPAEGLTPPERLAEPGTTDVGVRLTDVNGDGRPDFLRRLRRGGADAPSDRVAYVSHATLGASGKKSSAWVSDPSFVPPIPTASDGEGESGMRMLDITGDGLPDMIVSRTGTDGSRTAQAWENLGRGTGAESSAYRLSDSYEPPFELFASEYFGRGTVFLDVNGDGLVDAMTSRLESDDPAIDLGTSPPSFHWGLWLNLGPTGEGTSRWKQIRDDRFRPPIEFVTSDSVLFDPPYAATKDIPDHPDVVKYVQRRIGRDTHVIITDLNGDGITDIAWNFRRRGVKEGPKFTGDKGVVYRHFERTFQATSGARIGTPSGWVDAPGYVPRRFLDEEERDKLLHSALIDVNGDGLPDLVFTKREAPSGALESEVYLNTGDGWADPNLGKAWVVPNDAIAEGEGDPGFRFADVNGDGLVDILFGKNNEKDEPIGSRRAWLNLGWGSGVSSAWKAADDYAPTIALAWAKNDEDIGVRVADVDGDGLPDLMRAFGADVEGVGRRAWLNKSRRRDMLRTVTNGLELEIEVEYRSFASLVPVPGSPRERFYEPADSPGAYPVIRATPPAYLVRQVTAREFYLSPEESIDSKMPRLERPPGQPQVFVYRYGGFRFDVRAARPLGFAWRETRNETKASASAPPLGNREHATFLQEGLLSGRVEEVRNSATTPEGLRLYKVANSKWTARSFDALPRPDGRPYRYYLISLDRTSSDSFDLDGSSAGGESTSFRYDDWGNVVELVTKRSDGSVAQTVSEYPDVESALRMGRMASSTVTLRGDSNSVSSRRAEFKYDPVSRILIEETAYAGTAAEAVTSYTLDRFGNRVAVETRCVDCVPRSEATVYDGRGRLAVLRTNAAGHVTKILYDEVFGSATQITDPNGVVTKVSYDAHGRVASRTSPTGVLARTSYAWLPYTFRPSAGALFATVVEVEGLPPAVTWADCRSRTVREIAIGWRGQPIHKDSVYDALGRAWRVSEPYFAATPTEDTPPERIAWTETVAFDALNRPVNVVAPNGGELKYAYHGLRTDATDALKRTASTLRNARGLVVSSTDAAGQTLRFLYDSAGSVSGSFSPDGSVIRYEYDIAGRRTRMIDPDLGTWDYRYNGFGELVWQRDAKGQVTTVRYDRLGRAVRRKEADRTTDWEYDSAVHGIGALARLQCTDGYAESYAYDEFGRTTATTTVVKGRSYTSRIGLDRLNRVVTTEYPSGFTTRNEYDAQGLVARCSSAADGATLWKPVGVNQRGQVTLEQFGNGVTGAASFEDSTGRVLEVAAAWSSGLAVSYHRYEYDKLGNATRREDLVGGVRRYFDYDALNRMVRARNSAGGDVSVQYGPTGTIQFKSDVGTYSYDLTNGPAHAVRELRRRDGTIARFMYDANGGLISGPKGQFTYTAANLVSEVAGPTGRSTFEYSPSGRRCYEESCADGQITRTTSLGLYEEIEEEHVPPTRRRVDWMSGWQYEENPADAAWTRSGCCRVRQRSFVSVAGRIVAVHEFVTDRSSAPPRDRWLPNTYAREDANSECASAAMAYLHRDAIGSIVALTDANGKLIERLSYDEWGARSGDSGSRHHTVRDGFTGHLHLDGLGLIHMQARVFDPELGRFISADTVLDGPESTQGYDRYAYVRNNPLRYTDPTGHFFLFDFFAGIVNAIVSVVSAVVNAAIEIVRGVIDLTVKAIQAVGSFIAENWRTILTVAAVVAVTIVAAPLGAVAAGAIAGAVGSGLSTALYGGSIGDILLSMFKGAVIGGISGGAFNAAGGIGDTALRVGAHAGVGGAMEAAQGGDFFRGALSGAVSCASGLVPISNSPVLRVASSAVVGGTTSVIGGGKFENGAMTGAFGCAFNDLMHEYSKPSVPGSQLVLESGTGRLAEVDADGHVVTRGFGASGTGVGRNNPDWDDVPFIGPTTRGSYDIGRPGAGTSKLGGMRLTPQPGQGIQRSDFILHTCRDISSPGCSAGCPTFRLNELTWIAGSGHRTLQVVPAINACR